MYMITVQYQHGIIAKLARLQALMVNGNELHGLHRLYYLNP
jgi:hypothetical protein